MRDQVKTWTAIAAAPLLAAAFALPMASHAAEQHSNTVPAADMSSHDRDSNKDQAMPATKVDTKTSGANQDEGTTTKDTKSTYAEKTTTHTFHHKAKARHMAQPKADRN